MQVYGYINTLDLSKLTKEDLLIHEKMEGQYESCGNFRKCEEDLNKIKKDL